MAVSSDKDISNTEMPSPSQVETGEPLKIDIKNTDEAAIYLNAAEYYDPLSPEAERKLKRKMDWILLPMVRQFSVLRPGAACT